MTGPQQQSATPKRPPKQRRFRWRRWLAGGVLLAVLVWLLPSIIAITPMRNVVLDALIGDAKWEASAQRLSLSWVAPLSIGDLRMTSREESSHIAVDSLTADKAWWRLLWDRPALGRFVVDEPRVNLLLGDALPLAERRPDSELTFSATVTDAGITLRVLGQDDPPIDMGGFDVTVHVQKADERRELMIEPTMLFDHQELTEEMCSRGLHLAAPILAEATRVQGQFSLRLDDFRVPLDTADEAQISGANVSGQLDLHRVELGVRNPLLAKLVRLISRLLDVPVPSTVRIADESAITFELIQGRFHNAGLAFGLPTVSEDLVFRTSGSVGLDESLDLLVEVPLLGEVLGDGPIASQLAGRKLQVQVRGTIEEPRLTLPKGELLLQNLLAEITGGEGGEPVDMAEVAESALGIARNLLAARRETRRSQALRPPSDESAGAEDEAEQAGERAVPGAGRPARRPLRRLLNRLFDSPAGTPASSGD